MTLKIVALVCVVLAAIGGSMCFLNLVQVPGSPIPAMADTGTATYSLDTEFPQVKESYMIYQARPIEITTQRVEEIAQRFGLSGTPELFSKDTGEILLVDTSKNPEEQISVYAHSGAVAYHILDKELPTEITRQPNLPSDAEAEKIALALLEETSMKSPDARVMEVGVNQKQEVWKAGASEPETSYDVTKAVRFGRSLDGLPVYGDEFAVILGDGSEVVGLVKTWREVTPDRSVSIRSPEQAYEDLLTSRTVLPQTGAGYDHVTIENVSLGYWMEPRGVIQDVVWPVYVFTGTGVRDGIEESYLDFVYAVDGNTIAEG